MFLPIGDTPNPQETPYINYLLIGVNVAVFLLISLPLTNSPPDLKDPILFEYLRVLGVKGMIPAQTVLDQVSAYDLFLFRYGFRPAAPSLVTLFTSLFLHGGWLHLIGNMLFLWIFGDNVEQRLGRLAYLTTYLGTGVASTLFFAAFVPDSAMPLVGASGAISGVLGCYFLWFPRNKVKVFVFLFPFIMNTFMIPARIVLGFFLLVDNLLPFLLTKGGGSGVAHGAHIGGFLAGMIVAFFVDRLPALWHRQRSRSAYRDDPEVVVDEPDTAIGDQILRLLGQKDYPRAALLYESLKSRAERMGVGDETALAVAGSLLASGHYDRALSIYRRFTAERPTSPLLDRALLGAGKALLHKPRCGTSAYHYFLAALDVAKTRELAEEAKMHLRTIDRLGRGAVQLNTP
jgi:membrane associated rhomboid family serine protease